MKDYLFIVIDCRSKKVVGPLPLDIKAKAYGEL